MLTSHSLPSPCAVASSSRIFRIITSAASRHVEKREALRRRRYQTHITYHHNSPYRADGSRKRSDVSSESLAQMWTHSQPPSLENPSRSNGESCKTPRKAGTQQRLLRAGHRTERAVAAATSSSSSAYTPASATKAGMSLRLDLIYTGV